MDFIEQLFHVSPDGGNGLYEVALVVAVMVTAAAVRMVRHRGWPRRAR